MSKKPFKEQCAVLAYRPSKKGAKIVLVTSLETHRWVLPKGNIVDGLSARDSAKLEAFEEAGVEGSPEKQAFGTYEYEKTEIKGGGLCRVSVFPMVVDRILDKWPEKDARKREWMTIDKAAEAVNEGDLRDLILRFGKKLASS